MMMRVLLVTESYWPNADGGALFERRLVHGLITGGQTVEVWAPGRTLRSSLEHDGGSLIHREPAATLLVNPKYKASLWPWRHGRTIIRHFRPDVLHIHNAFQMGLTALLYGRRRQIPIVATNHFMPENALLNLPIPRALYNPLSNLIWAYLVWFHNRCQFVTSPTATAIRLLQEHGLRVPAEAISNGIDTAVFKPGLSTVAVRAKFKLPEQPIILYIGRIDGEKRLDILLDAFPDVLKRQSAHLVIAGSGKAMGTLQAQAKRLGITSHITFTGFLDEVDKPHLYNAATVFTITSPAELQSIVTLEAMASGLPIVATDVAALSELCHNGENGYLFPENNSAELAEHLARLLGDTKQAEAFGQESRRIVEKHHSTEVTFAKYTAAYRRVLEQKV